MDLYVQPMMLDVRSKFACNLLISEAWYCTNQCGVCSEVIIVTSEYWKIRGFLLTEQARGEVLEPSSRPLQWRAQKKNIPKQLYMRFAPTYVQACALTVTDHGRQWQHDNGTGDGSSAHWEQGLTTEPGTWLPFLWRSRLRRQAEEWISRVVNIRSGLNNANLSKKQKQKWKLQGVPYPEHTYCVGNERHQPVPTRPHQQQVL